MAHLPVHGPIDDAALDVLDAQHVVVARAPAERPEAGALQREEEEEDREERRGEREARDAAAGCDTLSLAPRRVLESLGLGHRVHVLSQVLVGSPSLARDPWLWRSSSPTTAARLALRLVRTRAAVAAADLALQLVRAGAAGMVAALLHIGQHARHVGRHWRGHGTKSVASPWSGDAAPTTGTRRRARARSAPLVASKENGDENAEGAGAGSQTSDSPWRQAEPRLGSTESIASRLGFQTNPHPHASKHTHTHAHTHICPHPSTSTFAHLQLKPSPRVHRNGLP